MKVLIINTVKEQQDGLSSNIDNAMTMELYKKSRKNKSGEYYQPLNRLTANHIWDKFIFIDEKSAYIGTSNAIEDFLKESPFLGNCLILTHEQWLDKQNVDWRTEYIIEEPEDCPETYEAKRSYAYEMHYGTTDLSESDYINEYNEDKMHYYQDRMHYYQDKQNSED